MIVLMDLRKKGSGDTGVTLTRIDLKNLGWDAQRALRQATHYRDPDTEF